MNYDEMSDFEINKAVAEALGVSAHKDKHKLIDDAKVMTKAEGSPKHLGYGWKDFCNNPSDAWPIILENKIDVAYSHDDGIWYSKYDGPDQLTMAHHENPLRAAMYVFLMLTEDKEQDND